MNATFREIPLSRIDVTNDAFSPSWPGESPRLEESIAAAGLIQPPLLVAREERLVPVCGLRRLRAARKIGLPSAVCGVLPGDGGADEELLALNVEENLSTRELDLFEKARLVRLALGLGEEAGGRLLARFSRRVGIATGGREHARLLRLDGLSGTVKVFLHEKRVPLRRALPFCDLTPADAAEVVVFARRLRFTAAQAAECAESLREIMVRDGLSLDAVLRSVEGAFAGREEPARGWREPILERIREIRYPEWKGREKAMTRCLDGINGTPGVIVRPPPSFEGDVFHAEIRFASPADLETRLASLERFAASDGAREAFGLL